MLYLFNFLAKVFLASLLISLILISRCQAAIKVHYLASDQASNLRIVLDKNKNLEQVIDYNPFGQIIFQSTSNAYNEKRKFLNQYYDEINNLVYLNARYYDPLLAKFISPDILSNFTPEKFLLDPQKLNSYSYGNNNPLIFLDPLGLSSAIYNQRPLSGWSFGQAMGRFNGVTAYYNGIASLSETFSCVEFAKRYQAQVYGLTNIGPVGDAKLMWQNFSQINSRLLSSGASYYFSQHLNNVDFSLPKEGDLLFSDAGQYGHVMVVTEAKFNQKTNQGYVEIIDQNASNQAVRKIAVNKNDQSYNIGANNQPIVGWLSPTLNKKTNNFSISTNYQTINKPNLLESLWQKAKNFIKKIL